jgi:hypothetical protein
MTRVSRATAALLAFCALAFYCRPSLADQPQVQGSTPAPSTAPAAPSTSAAASQPGPPRLPPNFDPCGGPQELLNKFGTTCALCRSAK